MLIAIELIGFAIAMAATAWLRQHQLSSLSQQELHLKRFAAGVTGWRAAIGVPVDARQAIELLVDMPINKSIPRALARAIFKSQPEPNVENNFFWQAREELDSEKREAFDWLLINYFLAMTYSDWFSGPLIRRVRLAGLSKETQAGIAIETVFSRRAMRQAALRPAAA